MAVELYDEHEQSERVRNWLRENGVSIVLGVVIALAAIFGWRQWQAYRSEQAMVANEHYAAIQREIEQDRLDAAAQQYQAMREAVGEHGYVALAGMLLASSRAEAGEAEAAAEIYRQLLAEDIAPSLESLARLRLAILEAAAGRPEAGLDLLEGSPPTGFEGLWLETRGDLLFDLGRLAEAAETYAAAVEQLRGEGSNVRQVEAKLDAVRSAAGIAEPA